jgi:hypothetical protein
MAALRALPGTEAGANRWASLRGGAAKAGAAAAVAKAAATQMAETVRLTASFMEISPFVSCIDCDVVERADTKANRTTGTCFIWHANFLDPLKRL